MSDIVEIYGRFCIRQHNILGAIYWEATLRAKLVRPKTSVLISPDVYILQIQTVVGTIIMN
jgi:hypothetical protein